MSLFRVKFHWYLCNEVHVSVVLSLNELFYDIRIIFNVLAPAAMIPVRSWIENWNVWWEFILRVSSTETLLCFQPRPRPIILGFNLDKNKYGMRKLQRTPWPRRLRVYVRKNQLWRAHYSGIIHLQRQKDLFRINLVSYYGLSRLVRIKLGQNGLCYTKVCM